MGKRRLLWVRSARKGETGDMVLLLVPSLIVRRLWFAELLFPQVGDDVLRIRERVREDNIAFIVY